MPLRRLILLLATLALLLAACGENGDDAGGEDESADDAASADAEEPEELEEEDLEDLGLDEGSSGEEAVDLPDGLAARVDGEEITTEVVEARYESVASVPEVEEQLEGEQGDQVEEQLRAQIVTRLILDRIVSIGADELGVEATDEDIEAREAEEAESAGGEEAFEDELAEQGITRDQLEEELRTIVLLEGIEDEVTADLDEDEAELSEQQEEMGMSAEDVAVQEWLFEQLQEREVEVDEEYGTWNPQTAQVVPEGAGMPQPGIPAPQEAPQEDSDDGSTEGDG